MCDSKLKDKIHDIITDFVENNVLFTALDVSNEVKKTISFARHKDVRDEVRKAWLLDIEPFQYARTPITVNLTDGTTADALLYHPLQDSWNLDVKYDSQQRAQTSVLPMTSASVPSTVATMVNTAMATASPVVLSTSAPVPVPVTNVKDLWDNLFQNKPSLFPRQ
jgi:hypothetical protein